MGGKFLEFDKKCDQFVTPETFSEEIKEFSGIAKKFFDNKVLPLADEMQKDDKKYKINLDLMHQAGDLGLLMLEIPEDYDGMGTDMTTSLRVAEMMSAEASFATTYLAHTGIGTLPIVFFGTEEQKEKYLPKLATGEWISAYALTETGYGSDALGAKTKAVLNDEKIHYIINGTKQFISNAGFADLFIVYAKVDGEHFTAFIIEKSYEGVKIGPEENKMGIHGSSTCPLILEDCKVPIENVLGTVGQGHRSALGILDVGRLKLGIAGLSGSKRVIEICSKYANERKQFGDPIGKFGMIRNKFSSIAARIYLTESAAYRVSGMIDKGIEKIDLKDPEYSRKIGRVFKEFGVETAIMKVLGSELSDFAIDEGVQIHGGYGFIEEYEVAKLYRDARITRIYEGTSEINRLLIPGEILQNAMKGKINLMSLLNKVLTEIKKDSVDKSYDETIPLDREMKVIELAKKMVIYTAGTFIQRFMAKLADKTFTFTTGEYFYEPIADLIIELFAMESGVVRAKKILENGVKNKLALEYTQLAVFESFQKFRSIAFKILSMVSKDQKALDRNIKGLWRLTIDYPIDIIGLRDKISDTILEYERWVL